jgi:hypothetical protein
METTRALMHGIIDYAGLFPPASLDMPKTVANYARYRSGEDRWALGRLVVPLKRIGEFERCAEGLLPTGDRDDSEEPWTLTVLSEAAGDEAFEDELDAIDRFTQRHGEPGAGRRRAAVAVISRRVSCVRQANFRRRSYRVGSSRSTVTRARRPPTFTTATIPILI